MAYTPAAELDNALAGLRLEEIQSFLVVGEELHFTKAAKRLNITPGGLSRRIAHLEQALGEPLLHRTTRSVRLSAAGQHFTPVARLVLAELQALRVGSSAP
jgi:DNA-binding transcriptional LysR family regulator